MWIKNKVTGSVFDIEDKSHIERLLSDKNYEEVKQEPVKPKELETPKVK